LKSAGVHPIAVAKFSQLVLALTLQPFGFKHPMQSPAPVHDAPAFMQPASHVFVNSLPTIEPSQVPVPTPVQQGNGFVAPLQTEFFPVQFPAPAPVQQGNGTPAPVQ